MDATEAAEATDHPENPEESANELQEIEGDGGVDGVEEEKGKSKRNRRRRQKLYSDIRKQMEFYFSDANITKNRLMKDMVQGSEYVELKVFLTFNKILALTKNEGELRKALKQSEKLETSPDGLGVKRKIPFDETKLKDEQTLESCTIYVENIPRNVGHEWVEKMFQEFGSIAYISLPKFKKSGQPKGFAFIEYEDQISAERCLEAYGSMGACLPSSIDPAELQSVKSFDEESTNPNSQKRPDSTSPNRQEQQRDQLEKNNRKRTFDQVDNGNSCSPEEVEVKKEKSSIQENSSNEVGVDENGRTSKSKSRKRRHEESTAVSAEHDENEISKKRKVGISNLDNYDEERKTNSKVEGENQSEAVVEHSPAESGSVETINSSTHQESSEKKRKRNRRKGKKNTSRTKTEVQLETDSIQLRILPKSSWRKLRNRYLNLQRENMSKLKRQLRVIKERRGEGIQHQNYERPIAPRSIFVKVLLEKQADSVDNFKNEVSRLSPKDWSNFLKFVDYNEGDLDAVVRFDGGPHAMIGINMFLDNCKGVFKQASIMTEDEATSYWNMVKSKTKQNQSKIKPRKFIRGKDRLTNEAMKVATHIRFCDEFDDEVSEQKTEDGNDEDEAVPKKVKPELDTN